VRPAMSPENGAYAVFGRASLRIPRDFAKN
jgi:hypothetical protein